MELRYVRNYLTNKKIKMKPQLFAVLILFSVIATFNQHILANVIVGIMMIFVCIAEKPIFFKQIKRDGVKGYEICPVDIGEKEIPMFGIVEDSQMVHFHVLFFHFYKEKNDKEI